mmetsp:Transcript_30385/g.58414  ORF Transcript_30385/g.58414 Transcript_30385/m.58414 type:complete len:215 (-) Transcript_30385:785-1429(-)
MATSHPLAISRGSLGRQRQNTRMLPWNSITLLYSARLCCDSAPNRDCSARCCSISCSASASSGSIICPAICGMLKMVTRTSSFTMPSSRLRLWSSRRMSRTEECSRCGGWGAGVSASACVPTLGVTSPDPLKTRGMVTGVGGMRASSSATSHAPWGSLFSTSSSLCLGMDVLVPSSRLPISAASKQGLPLVELRVPPVWVLGALSCKGVRPEPW